MISFTFLATAWLLCTLANYFLGINYLKTLRGEDKKVKDWMCIVSSLFFGGPVFIILYLVFEELRNEDKVNHYRYIISVSIIMIIEIVVLVLLGVYGIINFDLVPEASPETSAEILFLK